MVMYPMDVEEYDQLIKSQNMSIRRHTWDQVYEGSNAFSKGFGLGESFNCCTKPTFLINLDVV